MGEPWLDTVMEGDERGLTAISHAYREIWNLLDKYPKSQRALRDHADKYLGQAYVKANTSGGKCERRATQLRNEEEVVSQAASTPLMQLAIVATLSLFSSCV